MNRKHLMILATAALMMASAFPVAAHHAFSAEFDRNRPVTLEGKVVKMEWTNPHTWLYIDVTNAAGKVERWGVEGGAPGVMLRNGFDRNSFPEGTKVIVRGSGAKDGAFRANASSIQFPDGRTLDAGSSGGSEDPEKGGDAKGKGK